MDDNDIAIERKINSIKDLLEKIEGSLDSERRLSPPRHNDTEYLIQHSYTPTGKIPERYDRSTPEQYDRSTPKRLDLASSSVFKGTINTSEKDREFEERLSQKDKLLDEMGNLQNSLHGSLEDLHY
jgi:hypothetical protein